jgi:hypothetical protein
MLPVRSGLLSENVLHRCDDAIIELYCGYNRLLYKRERKLNLNVIGIVQTS